MEIKDIRTRNDFIAFLKEQEAIEIEDADVEEVADWFLAIQEARMILNSCTTKDLAHILLNGYDSIEKNPNAAHELFWDTFWEDVDYAREKGDEEYAASEESDVVDRIREMLAEYFNVDL